MTTEKAIEQLEDLIKEAESHMTGNKIDDEIPIDDKTALEMAIQALEKQIPKKVLNLMLNDGDGQLIKVFKGICPYCQCIVTNEYCSRCGQKSNIPLLKQNLDKLRQLMTQKTGGQEPYKKADDVSFEDFGTIINCIVIETMQLYLSGDLDRLEQSPCETCPYYPHDEDRKTMIGCNE